MKTPLHTIFAVALIASLAACGSDTNTTPTVTTPQDTASGGTDSGAQSDAGSTADGSASNGGSADAGSTTVQDAGPTKPKKCQPSDQACITACQGQMCSKEMTACQTDAKCTGFLQCMSGCAQGQEPPGNAQGATCQEKCRNIAGKAAVGLYMNMSSCTLNECVEIKKCPSTMPQAQLQQCANICVQAKCNMQTQECDGDEKCKWVTSCVLGCQQGKQPDWPPADFTPDPAFLPNGTTPTDCSGKCYASVPFESGRRMFSNLICQQSQCLKAQYAAPCPQSNMQCINGCMFDKCDGLLGQCTNDAACSAFFACLNIKKCGQNQACSTSCQQHVMKKYGASDAGSAVSTYQEIMSCAISQCVGSF